MTAAGGVAIEASPFRRMSFNIAAYADAPLSLSTDDLCDGDGVGSGHEESTDMVRRSRRITLSNIAEESKIMVHLSSLQINDGDDKGFLNRKIQSLEEDEDEIDSARNAAQMELEQVDGDRSQNGRKSMHEIRNADVDSNGGCDDDGQVDSACSEILPENIVRSLQERARRRSHDQAVLQPRRSMAPRVSIFEMPNLLESVTAAVFSDVEGEGGAIGCLEEEEEDGEGEHQEDGNDGSADRKPHERKAEKIQQQPSANLSVTEGSYSTSLPTTAAVQSIGGTAMSNLAVQGTESSPSNIATTEDSQVQHPQIVNKTDATDASASSAYTTMISRNKAPSPPPYSCLLPNKDNDNKGNNHSVSNSKSLSMPDPSCSINGSSKTVVGVIDNSTKTTNIFSKTISSQNQPSPSYHQPPTLHSAPPLTSSPEPPPSPSQVQSPSEDSAVTPSTSPASKRRNLFSAAGMRQSLHKAFRFGLHSRRRRPTTGSTGTTGTTCSGTEGPSGGSLRHSQDTGVRANSDMETVLLTENGNNELYVF